MSKNLFYCVNQQCSTAAAYFCFDHKGYLCNKCMTTHHLDCNKDSIKSLSDVEELFTYCEKLFEKLKTTCDSNLAQFCIANEVKYMKPYFFEYDILSRMFRKNRGSKRAEAGNLTQLFNNFQKLVSEMKKSSEYKKVIEFQFEQSLRDESEIPSKDTEPRSGNLYSNVVWKMGDEIFKIKDGIDESILESQSGTETDIESPARFAEQSVRLGKGTLNFNFSTKPVEYKLQGGQLSLPKEVENSHKRNPKVDSKFSLKCWLNNKRDSKPLKVMASTLKQM